MKKVIDVFSELPPIVADAAIKNTIQFNPNHWRNRLSRMVRDDEDAISGSFSWSAAPEGSQYWHDLFWWVGNKRTRTQPTYPL